MQGEEKIGWGDQNGIGDRAASIKPMNMSDF
jgi:hypothetical protein